jgi:hypothetical protein
MIIGGVKTFIDKIIYGFLVLYWVIKDLVTSSFKK